MTGDPTPIHLSITEYSNPAHKKTDIIIPLQEIVRVIPRRYIQRKNSVEVFLKSGVSYVLAF